jgi:hypothetical protein
MIVFVALVGVYTLAVILGLISDAHRIDAIGLALIAIAAVVVVALVRPESLREIKLFELGGIKVELRDLRRAQSDQQSGLDGVRVVLSILLPETEQAHLVNLLHGKTQSYEGGFAVRTELRHLRSLNLLRMRSGHTVEELRGDKVVNLDDYVQLTEVGRKSAEMISSAAAHPDSED